MHEHKNLERVQNIPRQIESNDPQQPRSLFSLFLSLFLSFNNYNVPNWWRNVSSVQISTYTRTYMQIKNLICNFEISGSFLSHWCRKRQREREKESLFLHEYFIKKGIIIALINKWFYIILCFYKFVKS